MTFKPTIWRPIAAVASAINLAGAGYAVAVAEPVHATVHVVLALVFGAWSYRTPSTVAAVEDQDRLEELDNEVNSLRRELSETQERLDFAERLLVREAEARRVGPDR
jgi:hypothetical protein